MSYAAHPSASPRFAPADFAPSPAGEKFARRKFSIDTNLFTRVFSLRFLLSVPVGERLTLIHLVQFRLSALRA